MNKWRLQFQRHPNDHNRERQQGERACHRESHICYVKHLVHNETDSIAPICRKRYLLDGDEHQKQCDGDGENAGRDRSNKASP